MTTFAEITEQFYEARASVHALEREIRAGNLSPTDVEHAVEDLLRLRDEVDRLDGQLVELEAIAST